MDEVLYEYDASASVRLELIYTPGQEIGVRNGNEVPVYFWLQDDQLMLTIHSATFALQDISSTVGW